jgi:hypothetical protein
VKKLASLKLTDVYRWLLLDEVPALVEENEKLKMDNEFLSNKNSELKSELRVMRQMHHMSSLKNVFGVGSKSTFNGESKKVTK